MEARTPLSPHRPPPGLRTIQAATLVLVVSMVFFTWDIGLDSLERIGSPLVADEPPLLHVLVEAAAVVGLGFATWVLRSYVLFLRSYNAAQGQTITLLRGELGRVLDRKFEEWRLTAAEREVAVMILKGATIADIAAARGTAQGTVKAQSTAIFRKIGVTSKAEMMSVFLDEFLENAGPPFAPADAPMDAPPPALSPTAGRDAGSAGAPGDPRSGAASRP